MLASGTYVLEVRGDVTGTGGGSYAGLIDLQPVPLPAALPLILSGLGLSAAWRASDWADPGGTPPLLTPQPPGSDADVGERLRNAPSLYRSYTSAIPVGWSCAGHPTSTRQSNALPKSWSTLNPNIRPPSLRY